MNDWQEEKDAPQTKEAADNRSGLGDTGRGAMQGNDLAQTPESDLRWTAQDGTADHVIYGQAVEDALDDPDKGINVYNNEHVTKPDGSEGIIDTRINNVIVDYKTHDMSNWTVRQATNFGHEHGQQVQDYVQSPDTPADAEGYVIAAGRRPNDPLAQQAYTRTLAEHDVGVKYPAGGEPQDIVNSAREAYQEANTTPPLGHVPQSAFGEAGYARRVETGAEKPEVKHFSPGGPERR